MIKMCEDNHSLYLYDITKNLLMVIFFSTNSRYKHIVRIYNRGLRMIDRYEIDDISSIKFIYTYPKRHISFEKTMTECDTKILSMLTMEL